MDYKDYETGQKSSSFWFAAKDDLTRVLLSKCCKGRNRLRVLNLGAGTGDDLKILNSYGKVYVIDKDKRVIELVKKELCFEKKVADACKLPYKDDFFDLVVSINLFEHIEDDERAVSEARRVLKKDGYLIFLVPAFQFLFSSHDKALDHKRRYNKKTLRKLLGQFRDLRLYYWNSTMFLPIALIRLIKKKKSAKLDNTRVPRLVDSLFYKLLKMENNLIRHNISMPFGVSIGGFCKK